MSEVKEQMVNGAFEDEPLIAGIAAETGLTQEQLEGRVRAAMEEKAA